MAVGLCRDSTRTDFRPHCVRVLDWPDAGCYPNLILGSRALPTPVLYVWTCAQSCSTSLRSKLLLERRIIPFNNEVFGSYSKTDRFNLLASEFYIIQINHQHDATIFQFIILTFVYSSTCFVVIVVLCPWSGRPAGPTTNTARLSPRYEGKTRGCHCSHWAPDDGRENVRNMLSCK
jgi:hypothetical protein